MSLPFSSAFGLPKCDVSHLVDPQSALCSSASVTHHYLVTHRHDIPLPSRTARSQCVTTMAPLPKSGYVQRARYIKTKLSLQML
jgi:hypothetical protein